MDEIRIINCAEKDHSDAILEIFNEAISNSTALFDYKPRTRESMAAWFQAKLKGDFPIIGAMNEHNALLGFVSYGPFRAWPAYKYTVEHSVYVHNAYRGKGIGNRLMDCIIEAARNQGYHTIIAGIESENTASIELHLKKGFVECGKVRQAGYKFSRWLDLSFYQIILDTPESPIDG